jgi:hypothetical protein
LMTLIPEYRMVWTSTAQCRSTARHRDAETRQDKHKTDRISCF